MADEATVPETQRAVTYAEYGDESVLKVVEDHPVPALTAGNLLIQVHAASVNPVDFKIRAGYIKAWPTTFPVVPGWDLSGVVAAVGEGVSGFAVGDAVFSYTRAAFDMADEHPGAATETIGPDGTHCEYALVPAWKVAKKPSAGTHAQAAAVPLAGLTAWQGLHDHGKIAAGQNVLILNASGGVGSFAVQFAKAAGATVYATCSAKNADYATSIGADHVIDYNAEGGVAKALEGVTVDLVYDAVGGESGKEGLSIVKNGGTVVSIVNHGVAADAAALGEERNVTGKGFLVRPSQENLTEIAALIDAGSLKYPSVTEMPLADTAKAHEASASHRVRGKIAITIKA